MFEIQEGVTTIAPQSFCTSQTELSNVLTVQSFPDALNVPYETDLVPCSNKRLNFPQRNIEIRRNSHEIQRTLKAHISCGSRKELKGENSIAIFF